MAHTITCVHGQASAIDDIKKEFICAAAKNRCVVTYYEANAGLSFSWVCGCGYSSGRTVPYSYLTGQNPQCTGVLVTYLQCPCGAKISIDVTNIAISPAHATAPIQLNTNKKAWTYISGLVPPSPADQLAQQEENSKNFSYYSDLPVAGMKVPCDCPWSEIQRNGCKNKNHV